MSRKNESTQIEPEKPRLVGGNTLRQAQKLPRSPVTLAGGGDLNPIHEGFAQIKNRLAKRDADFFRVEQQHFRAIERIRKLEDQLRSLIPVMGRYGITVQIGEYREDDTDPPEAA